MKNLIVKGVVQAMERGWISDALIRAAIKRHCGSRLAELGKQARVAGGRNRMLEQFVAQSMQSRIAEETDKANEQHYEVPAEFFSILLGPRLKYSCCQFDLSDRTTPLLEQLPQAEDDALRTTCERAEIEDGMDILELGCGWGSLTIWMAEQFPNSRITAVSNSASQRKWIMRRAERAGVAGRVQVITSDINQFEPQSPIDRVVSVEMMEHVRNHDQLFSRIANWMRPGGKMFVHIFCHSDFAYAFETEGAQNWMGQYFFSGGIMPSESLFDRYRDHLHVENRWTWNGLHYQRTCAAWREKMEQDREQTMEVLFKIYGKSAKTWYQRWKMFLIAGEELFGFNQGNEWKVCHYLFSSSAVAAKPVQTQKKFSLA